MPVDPHQGWLLVSGYWPWGLPISGCSVSGCVGVSGVSFFSLCELLGPVCSSIKRVRVMFPHRTSVPHCVHPGGADVCPDLCRKDSWLAGQIGSRQRFEEGGVPSVPSVRGQYRKAE